MPEIELLTQENPQICTFSQFVTRIYGRNIRIKCLFLDVEEIDLSKDRMG